MKRVPSRRVMGGLAGLLLLAWAASAAAESWGGITPGRTTRREIETLFGRPTRERTITEEGRTAAEWTYAGERAPKGLERLVVAFGVLGARGFTADVVRAVTLHPKPRVFTVQAIMNGWGKPDAIGTDGETGRPAFRYDQKGLLIVLDPTGGWAEILLFAPEKGARATP